MTSTPQGAAAPASVDRCGVDIRQTEAGPCCLAPGHVGEHRHDGLRLLALERRDHEITRSSYQLRELHAREHVSAIEAELEELMAAEGREERAREFAIMRAVGARASLLRQVQRAELMGVGLLAGFLASSVAVGVGWSLAHYVFEFDWTASVWVPLAGAVSGAGLAWLAGWWGLSEVLRQPVSQTLRQAAE